MLKIPESVRVSGQCASRKAMGRGVLGNTVNCSSAKPGPRLNRDGHRRTGVPGRHGFAGIPFGFLASASEKLLLKTA